MKIIHNSIVAWLLIIGMMISTPVFAVDTDGDGVDNSIDIDDDNDGILDTDEGIIIPNNGRFEKPVANTTTWTLIDAGSVPFWETTASDNKIEFWKSGFQSVLAYEGNQFVEMNANEVASLFQDISTTPGDVISWTIAHRGRSGVDEANVSVGPPGATVPFLVMSDGNTAWGVYAGLYTVPAGQTTTRISFDSVSAAGNNPSIGNFIDGFELRIISDSDGDGFANDLDLDSDNDGIPDNVEAQPTDTYNVPSSTWADADGDGLADQYDTDSGGTAVTLPDTDGDGIPDYLDSDSDNDGYTDCEEGFHDIVGKICPVPNDQSVGNNGMIDWVEYHDEYWHDLGAIPNGKVTEPNPDNSGQLQDEVTGNNEAAYREFLCGKNLIKLTTYQWRLISVPCDTGSNTIEDLFKDSLGTYGTNWVVYQQTGDDAWEVSDTHKNTNKTKLPASYNTIHPGKGYWIIADSDVNLTIPKDLIGLAPTSTVDASNVGINDNNFTKVHEYQLPKGGNVNDVKYMAGNAFPFAFHISDLYFKHNDSNQQYRAMGDAWNDTYINPTFYKHDSNETGPVAGYEAITPTTPGLNGSVQPMEGFFIKINPIDTEDFDNNFAYPLMTK